MKRHDCFFLGIMKHDVGKISLGALVQTICHKGRIVFCVDVGDFWKIGRGFLYVSPESGWWRYSLVKVDSQRLSTVSLWPVRIFQHILAVL